MYREYTIRGLIISLAVGDVICSYLVTSVKLKCALQLNVLLEILRVTSQFKFTSLQSIQEKDCKVGRIDNVDKIAKRSSFWILQVSICGSLVTV